MEYKHGAQVALQTDADTESDCMIESKHIGKKIKLNHSTPDSATSTCLLDLDDDCINAIFDLQLVSMVDLVSLTKTCTRLNGIANGVLRRRHKICDFTYIAVDKYETVLNFFGSSMSEIRIDLATVCKFGAKRIIDSMIENCTALKSLTITSYKIADHQNDITKLRVLFEKLEILHLEKVDVVHFNYLKDMNALVTPNGNLLNLFTNCQSLIEIKFVECYNLQIAIFESYLPKLQHFEYNLGMDDLECKVEGFILRHSNLKSLSLNFDSFKHFPAFEVMSANCKKLEKFEFSTGLEPVECESLKHLTKLERLTELTIWWTGQNVTKLMKEFRFKPLTELYLRTVQGCPELIPAISQIHTLRVLELNEIVGSLHNLNPIGELDRLTNLCIIQDEYAEFDFSKIVERLPNLKKFEFQVNGFKIGKDLYMELVKIIENRQKFENRHLKLRCATTNDFEDSLRPTVEFGWFRWFST